jgi:hypothetical protein
VAPWKLPFLVAAIALPIAAAFYLGGPGVGVAAGALAAVGIVVLAVGQRPRGAIGRPPPSDGGLKLLVVLGAALEDGAAVAQIAAAAGGDPAGTEVMCLAPARIGFLDRWASDVEAARRDAQRRLVISVASLAAAGIEAEARVGDEDVVQAVEDQLESYAASEVFLVAPADEDEAATRELRARLQMPFRRIELSRAAD